MSNKTYAVEDEFGNNITVGLDSYDAAKSAARRYLAAHKDAPAVAIYEEGEDGERWELSREEVLEGR